MKHIKTEQCFMPHLVSPQQKISNMFSDEWGVSHDRRSHGNTPVSQLVPGKKIPCVTEGKGEDEKKNSDDPVKFPWGPVGTGVKYPDHMEEDGYDHPVGSPAVQIS